MNSLVLLQLLLFHPLTLLSRVQLVLLDLMGGKSCDVPVGAMALPARPKYWVVILCNWKPEVTGPSGRSQR